MAIGVDIEDISRFENKDQKFLDRVYTKSEQQYCMQKSLPAKHLAVRYCAKEATVKALSALDLEHPKLSEIEVYHSENGCPQVRLLNKNYPGLKFEISLSHDKTKAIAVVTLEKI